MSQPKRFVPVSWYKPGEDPSWAALPSEEPLSDEMKQKVHEGLIEYYKWWRENMFRMRIHDEFLRTEYDISSPDPTLQLHEHIVRLSRLCNKAVLLYLRTTEHRPETFTPRAIFAALFKEWFRAHDNSPTIDNSSFIGSWIEYGGRKGDAPSDIPTILARHKLLWNYASKTIQDMKSLEEEEVIIHRGTSLKSSSLRRHFQKYHLIPLSRAIILVLDGTFNGRHRTDFNYKTLLIDEYSRAVTVLLVRTGEESDLSGPISFDSIRQDSLPLSRQDISEEDNGENVVRVPLPVGVRFIAMLLQREESAFPKQNPTPIDCSLVPGLGHNLGGYLGPYHSLPLDADQWANKMMELAEKDGFDTYMVTWDIIRRVKAKERHEEFRVLDRLNEPLGRYSWVE